MIKEYSLIKNYGYTKSKQECDSLAKFHESSTEDLIDRIDYMQPQDFKQKICLKDIHWQNAITSSIYQNILRKEPGYVMPKEVVD